MPWLTTVNDVAPVAAAFALMLAAGPSVLIGKVAPSNRMACVICTITARPTICPILLRIDDALVHSVISTPLDPIRTVLE